MRQVLRPIAIATFCIAGLANAQSLPTPTAEQLELLQSLPAGERQRLLDQFGFGSDSFTPSQKLEFPELVREVESADDALEEGPERITGGETLVIAFVPKSESGTTDSVEDILLERPNLADLSGVNTYVLSGFGVLELKGIAEVPVAGLTAEEVAARLGAELDLAIFDIKVQILPLVPTGIAALKYFGYDLFEGVPTSFAPATDIPVPADYVIGVGDELRIDYFGKESGRQIAVVSRDGAINLEGIGPVSIAGMKFTDARREIEQRVGEQKIGVRASVSLGELRSIRIFVLGDVNRPGSYVVSGLSTMTNALFLSGGIQTSGTLRRVQLKRQGRVIGTLDLYDLLLRGDTRADRRLLPGDVIFVPSVGDRVGIEGEVERPAYYELKTPTTAEELVRLAGGLTPRAFAPSGRINRIGETGARTVVDANLATDIGSEVRLRDGDVLRIFPVLERYDGSVTLTGHVSRPVPFQWREGLRLTDVIPSPTLLKPKADLGYVVIRREISEDGQIEVRSADLAQAYRAPDSDANLLLQPRDQISVFPIDESRGRAIMDLLDDLDAQVTAAVQAKRVEIGGRVRSPGSYPLEPGMRVSDLLRAGGGFTESAYLREAELTRYVINENGTRGTELVSISIDRILAGDALADELLLPYDYLNVREIPEWRGQESVTVAGEVRFPGVYPVKRGETLSSLIDRAGGLTDFAFLDGSVFTRETLRQREEEQIDVLVGRLEADLAAYSLQAIAADADAQQAFALGQGLLAQLRESKATGRLVIDLNRVLGSTPGSKDDIRLKNGDQLIVPQITQEVTVIGEVQYATSHIYDEGLDRGDYIARSGGITSKADEKRTYVVRANGEVIAGSGSRWLRRVGGTEIRPGDTIVVPVDADRIAPLTLWSSVTQIVYNLAVAVAAVNSF